MLQIYWLESVDSTQRYLKEGLKTQHLQPPVCVATYHQTQGQGSRGNVWLGEQGNLFFSFALKRNALPEDLRLESASIYFMYLLKVEFAALGSNLWLKWPNDFYIDNQKIGGCITNIQDDALICGIGVNTCKAPDGFAKIDVTCSAPELLQSYFETLNKSLSWKHVFINYKLEFEQNKRRTPYAEHVGFGDSEMLEDGSLLCQGQRMYSQR